MGVFSAIARTIRPRGIAAALEQRAIASSADDLAMDEASRMARAREMGFDVDLPLYHGTQRNVTGSMRPSLSGANGPGVYVGTTPETAASYAGTPSKDGVSMNVGDRNVRLDFSRMPFNDAGGNIMPLLARGKMADLAQYRAALSTAQRELRAPDLTRQEVQLLAQQKLQAQGYTGIRDVRSDYNVIFPDDDGQVRNVRSRFAAFDPAKSDSSDLLASLLLTAGGAGMFGALRQQDRDI